METTASIALILGNENVVCLFIFITVFLLTFVYTRKPTGIPPGPRYTLPFLGDLALLTGGDILGTFRKLREKHGDIFSLYLGKDLNIVINGYEVIHEAAVVNGTVFSGRPSILASDWMGGKKGLSLAEGALWKSQRRFTHGGLQHFGFGKSSFETKILKEVDCFINVLKATDGLPTDFQKYIHASVANIVFSSICGKRHDYDNEKFQQLLDESELVTNKLLKVSILSSCFPFLQHVPGDPLCMKEVKNNQLKWMAYLTNIYEEHARKLDENNPKDFFDMFILEMSKRGNPDFNVDQLCKIARDLFGGGAETTSTTIRWAVLYLLKYKDIKTRLQTDIDCMIPQNRLPRLEDKVNLPYVEAFIMEVLRCANVLPLAVPHAVTTDDVVFHGYKIPKDTPILFNLDSVLKESSVFNNPFEFKPERFLDADGTVFRPKEFIPFGIGRRICLGKAVAKMELFLFLTAMIKQFDFELPEDQSEPDLDGVLGITYAPKPFKVRVIKRFPLSD